MSFKTVIFPFFVFLRMDHMNLDRFLVVYDLRNMQQLAPVPVFIDPCFLHYHTMTSTSVMVASQVNIPLIDV